MKAINKKSLWLPVVMLLSWLSAAQAEDIELFTKSPTSTAEIPNVTIVIDNQSNWNQSEKYTDDSGLTVSTTRQKMIHQAMRDVLLEDPGLVDKINVGIVNITSGSERGGRVIYQVKQLTTLDQQDGSELDTRVDTMLDDQDPFWKASNSDYGMMMNEVYLYFSGQAPYAGMPLDNSGNPAYDTDAVYQPDPVLNPDKWLYKSPAAADACVKNYIVYIATGFPQNDHPGTGEEWLVKHGGDPTIIPLNPSNYEDSMADEFARFMSSSMAMRALDTYVIDIVNPDAKQTQGWKATRAFWRSIAHVSNGNYFTAWESPEIVQALERSFKEILAVNSVFAASSLPVSVNVRGTNLNQIYMGVFRPAENGLPRWMGNLKLYKLALDKSTNTMYMADQNDERADNPNTGFIYENAHSFWTKASAFWGFDLDTYRHESDAPDGDIVEKGAVAQWLRDNWTTRTVLTCAEPLIESLKCWGDLSDFTVLSTGLSEDLVQWVRGEDNLDDENFNGDWTDQRASIHGDVLHSRPAVLNYGGDKDIVIFYGANDGHFRAVRGGFGLNGGKELWSFVAPEHFQTGKNYLQNLRENQAIDSSTGKPYFMDGPVGVWYETDTDGNITKAWIYPTMRRGGRSVYAFNVTDTNIGAKPKILWRRADTYGADWAELGQTWSKPQIELTPYTVTGSDDTITRPPLLIMGGGYDAPYEDGNSLLQTMGRALYIVNAETGEIVRKFDPTNSALTHSIPGDITLISKDPYNHARDIKDRAYFADTGGNVWRLDMKSENVADWRLHKIANLQPDLLENPRKFLFAPDVVYDDNYDAILIGSGDREKPHKDATNDAFFMLKDTYTSPEILTTDYPTITVADLYDATDNTIQDGATQTERDAAQADLDAARGWMIRFRTSGEKTVSGAVTVDGTVFFSTHEPKDADTESCEPNLGTARNYAISFRDGTATMEQDGQEGLSGDDRYSEPAGGGFVPSPVPVVVEAADGEIREAVLRGTSIQLGGTQKLNRRFRSYWFTESDDK